MRQSQLFTKTRREAPKDEVAKNAQLLIRAGYIHKEMAGVYDLLPLGLRTFNNVVGIIRDEMNKIGGVELHLSALQNPDVWKKTDRWDDAKVDSWFKTELRGGGELGLGFTHEEPLSALMREHIASWRDLPAYVYQFQNKFRNEERAKSGLMRTREFVMKDLYSFSKDEAEHQKFYETCSEAYARIFSRVGLGERTYKIFAAGGSFSKYSHEFQTLCDAGEDTVYIDEAKKLGVNKEVYEDAEVYARSGLVKESLREAKAVEVGNIFTLGTRFSEALGLTYKNQTGAEVPVFMGSYGIGPARLMGTVVEVLSDEKGIVWPEAVAPYAVHLVELKGESDEVTKEAEELYRELSENGVEVLYDDTDRRAGEKFADSDLLGIPLRIVVSQKTLAEGKFECVHRSSGKIEHRSLPELISHLSHV
ncbi:MAG: aminoacyl--tRNA ligase-related protein [Patescibacteria group bacterium]